MVSVPSTMLPLGTPLSDFSLPDPEGALHGPSDYADAPALVVAFVCNHCPYVVHVGPELGRLTSTWMSEGVGFLGVNSNDAEGYPADAPELMTKFANRNGWTFPYLIDESQDVAKAYRAACTPDFFLFDGERKLVYRGRMDASRPNSGVPVTGEELDAAIHAVLDGKPVSDDQRSSIGCNIKWKPGNEPEWFG